MKKLYFLFFFFCVSAYVFSQDIALYKQFNGYYDFTAIGNTMNIDENNNGSCVILTSSSATLNMQPGQNIAAAYLYWAGSGTGDFSVELNNTPVMASRTFSYSLDANRVFFAAFADVTTQLIATGNGVYTLSELDLTAVIPPYCPTGTNFGGWAIMIIYEDLSLPLNQVSVYDGLPGVSQFQNSLDIILTPLNVIDTQDAKIGFLAWEGDEDLAVQETLQVNGNIISNPPLNPPNNAFNSTNSFTGSSTLYNMDIDVYNIESNIQIGDTSAKISLTSGQDLVMVNCIVTVLNSTLPDATIEIDTVHITCQSRQIQVDYTVYNINSTEELPANVPISFYADGILVGSAATQNIIPIGGNESGTVTITVPGNIPDSFQLEAVVDDPPTVVEINEDNNDDSVQVQLLLAEIIELQDLFECDGKDNNQTAVFDLTVNTPLALGNQTDVTLTYHESQNDADMDVGAITTPSAYTNISNPQIIYVRVESDADPTCYVTDSFMLTVVFLPNAFQPDDIHLCDDPSNDGVEFFDLTEQIPAIIGSQQEVNVDFYLTQTDADTQTNPIANPAFWQNTTNPQIVYVRVESSILDSCYSTTSFEISIEEIVFAEIFCNLHKCDIGFDSAYFDLTEAEDYLAPGMLVLGYYTFSIEDGFEEITNPENFRNTLNAQIVYVKVENPFDPACYFLTSIRLSIKDCPPWVPEGFSPNADGINDTFEIIGLYDIFPNFRLKIFSRYGNLIYKGNNDIPEWDGTATHGLNGIGNPLPTGTYFWVLDLNHPEYEIMKGWVYLNR